VMFAHLMRCEPGPVTFAYPGANEPDVNITIHGVLSSQQRYGHMKPPSGSGIHFFSRTYIKPPLARWMEEQDVCAKSGLFSCLIGYYRESPYLVGVVLDVSERAREVQSWHRRLSSLPLRWFAYRCRSRRYVWTLMRCPCRYIARPN
jgi:hypothetical protein